MKWYKHDPTAFLEGVIGLTAEERGFYITLIDLLYARDGHDVRDELVCKAMGCVPQVWRRVKARLMGCGKVREVDGALMANRVETTLKQASFSGVSGVVLKPRSAKINNLAEEHKTPRYQNPEYTSYVEAVGESQKRKKKAKNRSARSLASALNGGALTREPKTSARPTKISEELKTIVAAHKDKP